MTIVIKDPISGAYKVKGGDSLTKIASQQGRTLAELLTLNSQYKSNPNLINEGDVIRTQFSQPYGGTNNMSYASPQNTPSYNQLNTQTNTKGYSAPANNSNNGIMSVSDLLTKILKEEQAKSAGKYTGNMTALSTGKENIDRSMANLYSQDLANANLSNADRLSLLGQADTTQAPGLNSITEQQRINEAHYNSTNDMIKASQDAYDNEQDRILRAKESGKLSMSESLTASQLSDQKLMAATLEARRGTDGYVAPEDYRKAKAKWIGQGHDSADFDTIFSGYVNPTNAESYGTGFMTKVSSNTNQPTISWGTPTTTTPAPTVEKTGWLRKILGY